MRELKEGHEQEKRDAITNSKALQEELRATELRERHERGAIDAQLDGVVHTARNLGQIAAYLLQTGAMDEAADFYLQVSQYIIACVCMCTYMSLCMHAECAS